MTKGPSTGGPLLYVVKVYCHSMAPVWELPPPGVGGLTFPVPSAPGVA